MAFDLFRKNKKDVHFFCETCGAEVDRNAKNCPGCGSSFASVRCPYCDFVGEEALFKNGCPACGHSSKTGLSGSPEPSPQESKKPASALPVWVYILTSAALIAILAALFFTVFM